MKILFFVSLLSLFISSPAAAQNNSQVLTWDVQVEVNGMVCDFCARGLEKTLGKHVAVETIEVNLDMGSIGVKLKEGGELTDADIDQAIKDNGISVVSISRKKLSVEMSSHEEQ